ncbi:hypothetical protein TRFO_23762 [Tritrichomonas foetus]|uniref:RING-type domain-containing protein n=1 Tax=Tritrichomonas foetus TaxID=1144522 RepID=A0A1J4KDV1_9EUKA|nr:hypothetical protein TRFO_23762 [Tritrichomonas foetus]|eukprot:OHT07892.1 hypothetical protein TRFO_23762 [Tritrichomonas foetus]
MTLHLCFMLFQKNKSNKYEYHNRESLTKDINLDLAIKSCKISQNLFIDNLKKKNLVPNSTSPFSKLIRSLNDMNFREGEQKTLDTITKVFNCLRRFLELHKRKPEYMTQFFNDISEFSSMTNSMIANRENKYDQQIYNKCITANSLDQSPYYSLTIDPFYMNRLDNNKMVTFIEQKNISYQFLLLHMLSKAYQANTILFIIEDKLQHKYKCNYNQYQEDFQLLNEKSQFKTPITKPTIFQTSLEWSYYSVFSKFSINDLQKSFFLFDLQNNDYLRADEFPLHLLSANIPLTVYSPEISQFYLDYRILRSHQNSINVRTIEMGSNFSQQLINLSHNLTGDSLIICCNPDKILKSYPDYHLYVPKKDEKPIKFFYRVQFKSFLFQNALPFVVTNSQQARYLISLDNKRDYKVLVLTTHEFAKRNILSKNDFHNIIIDNTTMLENNHQVEYLLDKYLSNPKNKNGNLNLTFFDRITIQVPIGISKKDISFLLNYCNFPYFFQNSMINLFEKNDNNMLVLTYSFLVGEIAYHKEKYTKLLDNLDDQYFNKYSLIETYITKIINALESGNSSFENILTFLLMAFGNKSLNEIIIDLKDWITTIDIHEMISLILTEAQFTYFCFMKVERPCTIFGPHYFLYKDINNSDYEFDGTCKKGIYCPNECFGINHDGIVSPIHTIKRKGETNYFAFKTIEIPEQCYSPLFKALCREIFYSKNGQSKIYLIEKEGKYYVGYSNCKLKSIYEKIIKIWPYTFRSIVYYDEIVKVLVEIWNNGTLQYQTSIRDVTDNSQDLPKLIFLDPKIIDFLAENIEFLSKNNPPIRLFWNFQTINNKKLMVGLMADATFYQEHLSKYSQLSISSFFNINNLARPCFHNKMKIPNFLFNPALLEYDETSQDIVNYLSKYNPKIILSNSSFKGNFGPIYNLYNYFQQNPAKFSYRAYKVGSSDLEDVEIPESMHFNSTYNVIVAPVEKEQEVFNFLNHHPIKSEETLTGCILLCEEEQSNECSHDNIFIYHKSGEVEKMKFCKNCIKKILYKTIDDYLTGDKKYQNVDKIPGISIYDTDYDSSKDEYEAQIPFGALILNLINEGAEMEMLVTKWIKGVTLSQLLTNKIYIRCPNHPKNLIERNRLSKTSNIFCPVLSCYNIFCSKCHEWHHSESPCDSASSMFKKCPGCERPTIKDGGCNHIACPCGHHWCYFCGKGFTTSMDCYHHISQEQHGLVDEYVNVGFAPNNYE